MFCNVLTDAVKTTEHSLYFVLLFINKVYYYYYYRN